MRKFLVTFAYLTSVYSLAQNLNKQGLDSLFISLNEQNIGAGSVSIFENGKETYSNSFGNRDYENNLTNNKNTKFRIGSITKTFTATLIMKMIENGQLTLDTKLSNFYPKVKNADKISIQHLLQHQSGIFNLTNTKDFYEWYLQDQTKDELLAKIFNLESNFEPRSKEEYSNSNYILLGFILEDISKKTYQNLVERYIIKPLKLDNTKIGGEILADKNEAKSYNYYNNKYNLLPESSMTIPLGAGVMVSNPTDLNKFYYSLLNGKIVNPSTVKQMTAINNQFGYGLFNDKINESKGIGHNGGIDGFSSYSFCFENTTFCYTITQNVNEISRDLIKNNLYNATHNNKIVFPKKIKSIDVSPDILEKYFNEYSSNEIPISIKFFVENDIFMAQGTGQSAFPLTAISSTEFEFQPAKIKIEFEENGAIMKLIQNGKTFNFRKKL